MFIYTMKMSFSMYWLVVLFLIGCSLNAKADPLDLTLDKAQQLAINNSALLKNYDAKIKAAQEMAKSASELPDPVLNFGIDNLPVDGEDKFNLSNDFMTMRRVGIMQEMTRGQKRQLRSEQFIQQAQFLSAKKSTAIAKIEQETAIAWLNLYYAEAMFKKIKQLNNEYENNIKASEASYRAGINTTTDVVQTHILFNQFENKSDSIQRQIKTARIALERWIGNFGNINSSQLPDIYTVNIESNKLESHLLNHPEIIELSEKIDIAKTELHLANANKKSDWSFELSLQQRGSAYANMISIGASIPLQVDQKNRQNNQVYAQEFLIEAASSERDEKLKMHITEVRSNIEIWQELSERKNRYEKILLPLIRNQFQSIMAGYQSKKSTLIDILKIRQTEIEMEMEVLELEADIAELWAKINFILPQHSMTLKMNNSNKDKL